MTSRADLLQTEAAKRLFGSLVPVLIPNDNAGFFAMCLRDIEEEAAAISSSSATETQDEKCPVHTFVRLRECEVHGPKATETQDGERPHRPVDQPVKSRWPHRPHEPICEECGHAWRAPCHDWITAEYAPTPDDRDREVERIAAVLPAALNFYVLPPRTVDDPFWRERAEQIVAGLRASGGKT